MKAALRTIAAGVLLGVACIASAQDASRPFNPIARPGVRAPLPGGAIRVSPARPVNRDRIEAAVAKIVQAWNDRRLDAVLAPEYQRADELKQTLQTRIPRDARLRIVAIQGWQLLDQYRKDGLVYTQLSVIVRTQLEFNEPVAGFRSLDGTNEYYLTLTEAAR